MSQLSRFLIAGVGTVGLYIGGVWWGTEIAGFPPRAVNWVFYILATGISFLLAYLWIFKSKAPPVGALLGYILLQVGGIIFNTLWVEAGLRFTGLYPWVIAATYFAIWPFLSFTAQRHYIFK
ncbi:GtrA family protein [Litorimonas sp. RW-G-Af-16]|uniref:GtrA family protein n=1 Tax=Litorimonas sp. RW-G-Af-16 TaxID=3241168 RepID=UPI00390CD887